MAGKRLSYQQCCQPLHQGASAASPEALMRSRYTAYCLHLVDYLRATWHPGFLPRDLSLETDIRWHRLVIHEAKQEHSEGRVYFSAIHSRDGKWFELREKSRFEKMGSQWFYTQGEAECLALEPKRNQDCPCGSGKKFKRCCL